MPLAPHLLPRPVRLALYGLASAILLIMCLAPQEDLPKVGAGDKVEHAIAWFVLTVTGYVLAPDRRRAIPAYALAFGAVVEVLQAVPMFHRDGDWRDWIMDALGVATAALLAWAVRRLARS